MPDGYQITTIFSKKWDKFETSGYIDFWNTGYFIFEPQTFWKFSKRIYLGAEIRLSNYTLLDNYKNYAMLAFKWNLED